MSILGTSVALAFWLLLSLLLWGESRMPDRSVTGRDAPASPVRPSQADR